jgi:hypothetical protein
MMSCAYCLSDIESVGGFIKIILLKTDGKGMHALGMLLLCQRRYK